MESVDKSDTLWNKLRGMSEIGITKEYLGQLRDILNEKGFLSALSYDINSTVHSLGNRLGNFLDPARSNDAGYDISSEIKVDPKYEKYLTEEQKFNLASVGERIKIRNGQRVAYLFRSQLS
jgi:hypothetical protein